MTQQNPSGRLAADGHPIYDLVGIGFGPANLALAAAIQEEADGTGEAPVESVFLERKPEYNWHPGMLLRGALVQLSFLKDLATLRNPQSPFTFLNYLRVKGRLDKFINLRNFYPTRLEFNECAVIFKRYHFTFNHFSNWEFVFCFFPWIWRYLFQS